MSSSPADFNAKVIEEFRSNEGRVGGPFEGLPLLLLHHTGARSGTERVNPLAYARDEDRYVVFASKAGAPTNPDWYHNLLANPSTRIEVGTEESTCSQARRAARSASGSTARRPRAYRSSPSTSRRLAHDPGRAADARRLSAAPLQSRPPAAWRPRARSPILPACPTRARGGGARARAQR